MLDEAMGWALWGLARRVGVTREMVVRFHRPIVIEKPYRILGRIERMDDAAATVLAEVRDARDRLAADGTGEFTFISLDKVRDRA